MNETSEWLRLMLEEVDRKRREREELARERKRRDDADSDGHSRTQSR